MNINEFSKLENKWFTTAKKLKKTIVLPEAYFSDRVYKAGVFASDNNLCEVVFLTDNDEWVVSHNLQNHSHIRVINILSHELIPMMQQALYIKRKDKGITLDECVELLHDPAYFGVMMVELGLVDGMVCGAELPTIRTFKPALQIIKGKNGSRVSTFMIMQKDSSTLVLSDVGLNANPTSEELAEETIQTYESAVSLANITPSIALLSYSTNNSADGESVQKVRDTVQLLKDKKIDFEFDGEMQLDCAIDKQVRKLKFPNCALTKNANVLIFPNLESGNIGYKILQRFGGFTAIGPIAQGLAKPVNDISRGASVHEIVSIIAITIIQSK